MLRDVDWKLFTDVSVQPIDPIFKSQAVILLGSLKTGHISCPKTSVKKLQIYAA